MRVLQKGAQLANRYTLVRQLGSGGMSETWLAQDRQTGKSVALKFLSSELSDQPAYCKLLRKEWQLGSRLMHANIVRVFEYYDEDEPYYSLQYLGGSDISVITGEPADVVLRPIGLIADALRYAHGKSIVHRDIKASNILLDARGVPYLIDFGIAAAANQPASGGSEVASSPQQLAGEPARPEDDIYALGVLIHELLSGQPPAAAAANLPAALQVLVAEMLSDNPAMRPDAESVAQRLRDAGFQPGLVPGRFVGSTDSEDIEPVETTITLREHRAQPHTRPAQAQEEQSGISPKVLGTALAAALVLFLVVVFGLPKMVGSRGSATVGGDSADATQTNVVPTAEDEVLFNENIDEFAGREDRLRLKYDTEQALGELLSKLETLESRAVGRWGGQTFKEAQRVYADGDREYLRRNYRVAGQKYKEALEIIDPLVDEVDDVFNEAMQSGSSALEIGDSVNALLHYELAVAISPGHAEAHNGLTRARNLDLVMSLTRQGVDFEKDLDFEAARLAFEKALGLDAEWQPATEGLQRVLVASNQLSFEHRMSEGLEALADGDFPTARAAFRTAQILQPESREPGDGLL